MSLPWPTTELVLAAMMAQLGALKAPSSGVTSTQYLRVLDRYVAGTITGVDSQNVDSKMMLLGAGVAGRTPAVLIDYVGDRPIRTTIGYKVAKVESTYIAICVADPKRPNREAPVGAVPGIFQVCEDVRVLLGSRAFGFNMQPLRFAGIAVLAEKPEAYAWGVKFTSRRHVDYTKKGPFDTLLTVNDQGLTDGQIKDRYGNVLGGMTVRF
jgi:hypothetical protein